jgi:hypothetical protein
MHGALISRDGSFKRLCREVLATLPALGGQGSSQAHMLAIGHESGLGLGICKRILAVSGESSDAGRGGMPLVAEMVGGEKA